MDGGPVKLLPTKGADLNPIENLWALVSRKVYPQNKTYTSIKTLREAIEAAWGEIRTDVELCRNLIDSMPNRLQQVVRAKGGLIGK
jgi:hypothetical protein